MERINKCSVTRPGCGEGKCYVTMPGCGEGK